MKLIVIHTNLIMNHMIENIKRSLLTSIQEFVLNKS